MTDLKILRSEQIDRDQWDSLVLKSPNGSLFCTYDYFSLCEGEWEALIYEEHGEYVHAIPIPYRMKLGIKYIYQSPLQVYLTILSHTQKNETFEEVVKQGMEKLSAYRYVAKYFFRGDFLLDDVGYTLSEIKGLQINLQREYTAIFDNYSKFRKRMLKKAKRRDQQVTKSDDLESFTFLHEKYTLPKIESLHHQQKEVMRNLWKKLYENDQLEIYFALSNKTIVGGILIGKFGNFIHALASFNSNEGRKMKSNTLLKDYIIKFYAQSDYHTFELGRRAVGSIDDFKLSFGAENYTIYQMYRNDLPWFIKAPKKILNLLGIGFQ